MGKMKELFMKTYYPEYDLEREYLVDQMLADEREYLAFLSIKKEFSNPETKIEIGEKDEKRETRIEVNQEEHIHSQ